jgi:adenylate kinase family enzyme
MLLLSGPPGAGKTTLARRMVEGSATPAVHLHTDDYFGAIRSGFILAWLPEAHAQNQTVTRAIVAAAGIYAEGGYEVIIDGVVGPLFLGAYRDGARRLRQPLDYVILRPDRATAVARVRDRDVAPLADYPPGMYEAFTDAGPMERHVVETTGVDVEAVLAMVRAGLAEGRFRL